MTTHESSLSLDYESYLDFAFTSFELNSNPDLYLLFELTPTKKLGEILHKEISYKNAIGLPYSDYKLPLNFNDTKAELISSEVFNELKDLYFIDRNIKNQENISVYLTGVIDEYLKSFYITSDLDAYEPFRYRLFGLVSYVYGLYVYESKLNVDDLVIREGEVPSAVKSAQQLISILNKHSVMNNFENKNELQNLLKQFIKSNTKSNNGLDEFQPPVILWHENRNIDDHAFRLMVMRLTIFFKLVNRRTPKSFIRAIAKCLLPSISDSPISGGIASAKDYMFGMGMLKEQLLAEEYSPEAKAQIISKVTNKEIEKSAMYDWNSRTDARYRELLSRKISQK